MINRFITFLAFALLLCVSLTNAVTEEMTGGDAKRELLTKKEKRAIRKAKRQEKKAKRQEERAKRQEKRAKKKKEGTEDLSSPLAFYVVGDVPYSEMEECLLPFELRKLKTIDNGGGHFLIHLGDIDDGRPPSGRQYNQCPESVYSKVSDIFELSPVTTFFIPGDNTWVDCADVDLAYRNWNKHLFHYNTRTDLNWPTLRTTVYRDHPTRHELFAFSLEDMLFLGLSLPGTARNDEQFTEGAGSSSDRTQLHRDNEEWTTRWFEKYPTDEIKAIVIFAHDAIGETNQPFWSWFAKFIRKDYTNVNILIVHDSHDFDEEAGFLSMENVYLLSIDDTVTPIKIEVDTTATKLLDVFQHNHYETCWCSSDHKPTQLKTNNIPSCNGACDESHAHCKGSSLF